MKIHYSEQLEDATLKTLESINKGLVKTALQIRDEARMKFVNNVKGYKISKFKEAIQVGKLRKAEHRIVIHGFGAKNDNNELWKGRFFILGTQYREQDKIHGKKLNTPKNIGRISALETLDHILHEANVKLQHNIKESINYATNK